MSPRNQAPSLAVIGLTTLNGVTNMATKNISDTSFDSDVLQADRPVLVDFWAD